MTPCGSEPPALPLPGLKGGPGEGHLPTHVPRDCAQAHPIAGRHWPGQASHSSGPQPPECFVTTKMGSHGPDDVPVGSGEPSSHGSGHGRNAQQVCPPATHPRLPSIQHHPCLHLLQEDPTPLPGVGKARPGPPTAEGLSWKGPLESGGPQPQMHMNKDEVVAVAAGRRGGARVPSHHQGGSSQEGEAACKKAAPHGQHLPARPQEDPRKHKACSGIFT